MLPPQHLPPLFSDIMEHLPRAQQLILPLLSFEAMEQVFPSLPLQQSPPWQQSPC